MIEERTMARLQLDLSETQDELITELMAACDLRTKKDVIENALMLLGWAAVEAGRGLLITAVDEQHKVYKEVQTPALIGARRVGAKKMKRPLAASVMSSAS
jgi:hypothetical protein